MTTEVRYDIDGVAVSPGQPGMTKDALLQAWRDEDERVLAEHGGDPDKANRALGLTNQAEKWNEEARTNAALRDGTPARQVHDRVMAMDPIDREAEYPPALTDDPETADSSAGSQGA